MDTSAENEEELQLLTKMLWLEGIIIGFCSIAFVIYSIVAVFVFKKIGNSNFVMSLMVISIGLVILTLVIFFSVNMRIFYTYKRELETDGDIQTWNVDPQILQVVQVSPGTLLQMAIVLNINMWTRFYFKILGMASSLKLKSAEPDEP